MRIVNHRLCDDDGTEVPYVRSPNQGGALAARFLVMHFTAGASAESSIAHLTRAGANASAHLVVARDGSVTQLVAFNRVAWHAGQSRWQGLTGLNHHAIGVELDNAGELTRAGEGWATWFQRAVPDDEVVVATHKNGGPETGWQRFTAPQIDAALAACAAVVARYDIEDVIGHDDIAPGRKRDPGPAFPLDTFRSFLIGRARDDDPVYVTAASLNIREGPGTSFDRLPDSPLAKGTRLTLAHRAGLWCYVEALGEDGTPFATGWVHGHYIRAA